MEMKQRIFMTKDYLKLLISIILEIMVLLIGFDIVKSKLIIIPLNIFYLLITILVIIGLLCIINNTLFNSKKPTIIDTEIMKRKSHIQKYIEIVANIIFIISLIFHIIKFKDFHLPNILFFSMLISVIAEYVNRIWFNIYCNFILFKSTYDVILMNDKSDNEDLKLYKELRDALFLEIGCYRSCKDNLQFKTFQKESKNLSKYYYYKIYNIA